MVWTPSAQADLIRKALVQLGVEKPVLVGHSWGTLVALAYALEHPAHTGAVLLLSGYDFPSKRIDVVIASLAAMPILGEVLRYTVSPLLGWLPGRSPKDRLVPSRVAGTLPDREFPFALAYGLPDRATAGDASLMVPAAASL